MNTPRIVRIYSEGADDRAFLNGLKGFNLLPPNIQIAPQTKNKGGASTLLKDTMPFALPRVGVGGLAIVLRDFDGLTPENLRLWFEREATTAAVQLDTGVHVSASLELGRRCVIDLRQGEEVQRLIGIGVGLPHDPLLRDNHGVTLHAIDDYLFSLALRADVYEAMHREFSDVPHELALKKLREVPELLRRNGLVVNQSKRIMHLFRATTGFRAAPATFIERLFDVAQDLALTASEMRAMALPLVDDLEWAASEFGMPAIDAPGLP